MSTVSFQVPEEKAARLAEAAKRLGVQVDELLQRITDDYLARNRAFDSAAKYVLEKNAELYRRLATAIP